MVNYSVLIGAPVLIIGVVLIGYTLALRSKYHYTSRLTCPKCNQTFEYKWVPGASFSAFRLGKSRHLRCPKCHEWSTFDILDTRVTPGLADPTDAGPQRTSPI